jgi:hypothetical protein
MCSTQSAAVTAAMRVQREQLSDHLHACVIRVIPGGKDDGWMSLSAFAKADAVTVSVGNEMEKYTLAA